MSEDNYHIIRRQVVSLQLPPGSDGFAWQQRVSHVCRERLQPRLEELLSRFSRPDELIQLDRVELDLGIINVEGMEEALTEKVIRALEQRLYAILRLEREPVVRFPQRRRVFEQWLEYLGTGALPWHSTTQPEAALLKAVLEELSSEQPSATALRELLKRNRQAFLRLIRQYPNGFLATLAEAASGEKQDALLPLLERILLFWQAWTKEFSFRFPVRQPITGPLIREYFWLFTFEKLILQRMPVLRPELHQSMIRRLLPREYRRPVLQAFRAWKKPPELAGEIERALAALKPDAAAEPDEGLRRMGGAEEGAEESVRPGEKGERGEETGEIQNQDKPDGQAPGGPKEQGRGVVPKEQELPSARPGEEPPAEEAVSRPEKVEERDGVVEQDKRTIPGQNGFLGLWDTGIECWTTLFWQQVVLSALSGWLSLIALFLLHLPFFVMNEDVSISDTFFREWLYSNFHIVLTLVLLCVLKYKGLFSEKASRESFVYFMFIFGFRTFFVLSRSLF